MVAAGILSDNCHVMQIKKAQCNASWRKTFGGRKENLLLVGEYGRTIPSHLAMS